MIGSGRTEMARCLYGLTRPDRGRVEPFGRPAAIRSPVDAIRQAQGGRWKVEGIFPLLSLAEFPLLSVAENAALPSLDRFRSLLGMRNREMMREVAGAVGRMRTKLHSLRDLITSLSGGNQQKVIIARWLLKEARVLVMDEPTRGIDVNAKYEIQAELRRLTEERGLSIVLVSSEMGEVLDVADRILVMHMGRARDTRPAAAATQEPLLQPAMN